MRENNAGKLESFAKLKKNNAMCMKMMQRDVLL